MAKLFVSRPRLGRLWDIEKPVEVLVDADPKAKISLGETILINLPRGPHQVGVR
jgi:hypothetical protein